MRNEPEAIAKHHFARLLELAGTMESKAAALDIVAETTVSQEELVGLRKAAELCRGVAETIRSKMN